MDSQETVHPQVLQLCRLLENDFTDQLETALSNSGYSPNAILRIEARVCAPSDPARTTNDPQAIEKSLVLVRILFS